MKCGEEVLLVIVVMVWPDGTEEWKDKENEGEAYIFTSGMGRIMAVWGLMKQCL